MPTLLIKTRIAVLWIIAAVAMSAHMILMSFDPAAMKKVTGWTVTAGQGDWLFFALFWLVPLWMAFLAMTLPDSANRWVSGSAGVLCTLVGIWHFFICGVPLTKGGPFAEPTPHHILLVGSSAAATGLIAWYAWSWPRTKA